MNNQTFKDRVVAALASRHYPQTVAEVAARLGLEGTRATASTIQNLRQEGVLWQGTKRICNVSGRRVNTYMLLEVE